jgi:hypothetical protein
LDGEVWEWDEIIAISIKSDMRAGLPLRNLRNMYILSSVQFKIIMMLKRGQAFL